LAISASENMRLAIVSYLVNERMHETGVRVPLGAQCANLLSFVFSAGMRLITIGVLAGLCLLLPLSQLLGHFVYQVRVVDPLTYLSMSLAGIDRRSSSHAHSGAESNESRSHDGASCRISSSFNHRFRKAQEGESDTVRRRQIPLIHASRA
jgi:hypothetical protein